MSEPFIAQIVMFGGNFAPRSWAFCSGQILPINQNQALFSLLGTTYGGDGRTNFALPDLRGRFAMHAGSGPGLTPRRLGEKSGVENVTLTTNQLPAHSHNVRCQSAPGDSDTPVNAFPSVDSDGRESYRSTQNATMGSAMVTNTGGGQAVQVVNPFTVVNYIIALQGVFPSRN